MNQWEELQLAATNGRVSRREFMRRAAALGVATSLASGVLAKAGYAQTPVKGGHLRLGSAGGSTTDSMYVRTCLGTVMINISTSIFDGLVEVDDKNQIQPELLETLEPQRRCDRVGVQRPQGITFSNGKTLDAHDVKSRATRPMACSTCATAGSSRRRGARPDGLHLAGGGALSRRLFL